MSERIYNGEICDFCANCLEILSDGEEYIRCEVCGDLYCVDCIRKNEIDEYVCVRCVEEWD